MIRETTDVITISSGLSFFFAAVAAVETADAAITAVLAMTTASGSSCSCSAAVAGEITTASAANLQNRDAALLQHPYYLFISLLFLLFYLFLPVFFVFHTLHQFRKRYFHL